MVTGRPTTMAVNGMVATPHYLASQTGLRVLREGGNAVDAAVAANAVLTVVMPDSCSIGGDAFCMLWDPGKQVVTALNGSGRSGAELTIEKLRAMGHTTMPERGPLSVTVPGTVHAWQTLMERYGTRELGDLLADAISYAREGFPVTPRLRRVIEANALLLQENPAARRQFLPSEEPPAVGSILRQPALAMSLQQIGRKGAEVMYSGVIGERIAKDIARLGGTLMLHDFASHTSDWVEPIRSSYRGFEILELPPNTQGATALQMLNIAETWEPDEFELNSADQIHRFVEAKKHAFKDRDRFIGDPEFVDVPVDRLVSKEYAHEIRSQIDPEKASVSLPDNPGAGDTIYMCVFDTEGLAVSLIQSVFRGFGSGIVAEGTGVLLHNRGASFQIDEDAANKLEPGKRPLHTLIPGMVLKDGRPWNIFGSMGGHGQAQFHLQLLNKMIDFEMDAQEAIESPRWVAGKELESDPEHLLRLEPEIGEDVAEELRQLGHEVRMTERFSSAMGHAQAIRVDWENGVLHGGADPRADGYALGW